MEDAAWIPYDGNIIRWSNGNSFTEACPMPSGEVLRLRAKLLRASNAADRGQCVANRHTIRRPNGSNERSPRSRARNSRTLHEPKRNTKLLPSTGSSRSNRTASPSTPSQTVSPAKDEGVHLSGNDKHEEVYTCPSLDHLLSSDAGPDPNVDNGTPSVDLSQVLTLSASPRDDTSETLSTEWMGYNSPFSDSVAPQRHHKEVLARLEEVLDANKELKDKVDALKEEVYVLKEQAAAHTEALKEAQEFSMVCNYGMSAGFQPEHVSVQASSQQNQQDKVCDSWEDLIPTDDTKQDDADQQEAGVLHEVQDEQACNGITYSRADGGPAQTDTHRDSATQVNLPGMSLSIAKAVPGASSARSQASSKPACAWNATCQVFGLYALFRWALWGDRINKQEAEAVNWQTKLMEEQQITGL